VKSFQWGSNYLTGILSVDEQHKELVNLLNKMGDILSQNSDTGVSSEINATFDALAAYAQYHFSEEEKLMTQAGISNQHVDKHILSHQGFLSEVTALRTKAKDNNPAALENLLDFLIHWLAYHILGTDMNMAKQIELMKSGLTPEQAFIQEEQNPDKSTEPLITALNGLFSQISQRNQELTLLNQTLESKVNERTKALLEANNRLEKLSLTDVLTKLPNRRHAIQQLTLIWNDDIKHNQPVACMMVDADNFKQVNDTYGHDAGDLVLKELSKTLLHTVRTDDIVCRLGGDEFLIICPNTDLAGGMYAAELVQKTVSELQVPTGNQFWEGSVSIGVAVSGKSMKSIDDLIKAADQGVYLAKQDGKNCVRTVL